MQIARETQLGAAAEGGTLGTLQSGAPARVLARSGERVKVQVEGWVAADALAPSDSGALVGVSAAEVRAVARAVRGADASSGACRSSRCKPADELRSEMAPGQPYLLTRGPLPEPGFVYVSIPAERGSPSSRRCRRCRNWCSASPSGRPAPSS